MYSVKSQQYSLGALYRNIQQVQHLTYGSFNNNLNINANPAINRKTNNRDSPCKHIT